MCPITTPRYALPMSDLDAAAQPSCPTCLTVMQPTDGGDGWRECEVTLDGAAVAHPGDGEGIIGLRSPPGAGRGWRCAPGSILGNKERAPGALLRGESTGGASHTSGLVGVGIGR